MNRRVAPPSFRSVISFIGLIVVALAASTPAFAQHRARLDKSLAEQVRQQTWKTFTVFVDGPQSEIDRLLQTYGVKVVERFDGGALVSGSGQQVDLLANDPQVPSVQENGKVFGTLAVTTQSTGANQLWAGKGSPFG